MGERRFDARDVLFFRMVTREITWATIGALELRGVNYRWLDRDRFTTTIAVALKVEMIAIMEEALALGHTLGMTDAAVPAAAAFVKARCAKVGDRLAVEMIARMERGQL